MDNYFSGKKIYGDNFTIEQIQEWFEAEKEGYANLGNKEESNYSYQYHTINKLLGLIDCLKTSLSKTYLELVPPMAMNLPH